MLLPEVADANLPAAIKHAAALAASRRDNPPRLTASQAGMYRGTSTAEDHAPAHWRPQPSSKLGGAGGVGGALRAAVRKLGACTSVSGGLRQCARARRRAFQRSPRSTADAMTDEHSRAGADAPVENCSRGTVFMNTARHPPAPGAVALLDQKRTCQHGARG